MYSVKDWGPDYIVFLQISKKANRSIKKGAKNINRHFTGKVFT